MGSRLAEKVCLITGAGSGIGRATAIAFAGEGARVVVADLDLGAAGETGAGVVDRFGRIDVLFNTAGIPGVGDVLETEPELFDRVMRVNVRGVYLMSRA